MRTTWALAVLLFSSAASAQEPTPPPASKVDIGRAEIAKGDYEAGIAKLIEENKNNPSPDLLFEIAVAYSLWQGHCQDAISTFDKFFAACQKCSSFEAAKERLTRVRETCVVKVRVESEPAGAMISIDGLPIGTSPLETTVIAGQHGFEAELSGFGGPAVGQTFLPGQTAATVKLSLAPLPAFIELKNIQPEIVVLVSG